MSKDRLCFLQPKLTDRNLPLFVYLPGMDGTGKLFKSQADGLQEYFDLRCLNIPTGDLNNWQSLSDRTIFLIKQELANKTNKSVYLCGESFGGCLALKIASVAPNLFQQLILVNPASSCHRLSLFRWGVFVSQLLPEYVHWGVTIGFLPFLAALERVKPRNSRQLLQAMRSVPPRIVAWRLSLLRDFSLEEERLQKISQPVSIIASASDRLLPSVEEAQRLANIFPDTRTTILPNSGHACLLETDVKLDRILTAQNLLPIDRSENINITTIAIN